MKPQHGLILLVTFLSLSVLAVGLLSLRRGVRPTGTAESYSGSSQKPLEPLFPAPDFELADQRGGRISKASLQGKPFVANFIFTTCKSVCPLLTAKMVQLQKKLPKAPMAFVSFSVDPEHDDPMTLAAYAQGWAPDEPRWHLLANTPETLTKVTAGFRVTAQKNDTGKSIDPIIHSSVFLLVDQQGVVRGIYDSEHRDEWEALIRDARTLSRAPMPPPQELRSGPELYTAYSCAQCHDNPALAPPLGGLFGKDRQLEKGLVVKADEPYFVESLVAPDAKRVQGYPLHMPNYDGVLGLGELEVLVKYMKELPEAAPQPPPQVEEDPICHMQVKVTKDTPSAQGDGGRVYFCSDSCKKAWLGQR